MSAELDVYQESLAPAIVSERHQWADELMAWARAADAAHGVATLLAETSFVPKSMQHRPGDVTGAILTGVELGVPIMWALSNIDIVEGAPAIRAKGLRGLMKRHRHEIWVEETTATRAVVCARHRDSQRIERSVWTLDRAKKAELLGKKNWRLYPTDMLLNRATAEAVRLAAPDVLLGHYTVDELGGDEGPQPVAQEPNDQPAPAAKRRTAKRAKPEAPAAPDELPADVPQPTTVPPFPTDALPATCDLSMPHDSRFSPPAGCPPNCPTRIAADEPEPVTEDNVVAMFADAGLDPVVVMETADVVDTMDNPVSEAQRKRMAVEMRKAGIVDRGERLEYVSNVIGRRVESGNELTISEASRVIQALIDDAEAVRQGIDAVEPTEGDS